MGDVTLRLTLQEDVSTKLQKVATTAQTTTNKLQQTGKAIDNAFKTNSPDTFASKLGNAMDEAISDADSLGNALEEIDVDVGNQISDGFEEAIENIGDFDEKAAKVGESIDDLAESAEGLGESFEDIDGKESLGGLSEEANAAGESMEKAETKATSFADALKKLFAVVSAAAILSQVSSFASSSVEIGQNFTAMMSEVEAISGASTYEITKLEETARNYGATTIFSASEAAEALKYMSLAGWDADQSSSALGGVLNLAAASGMGLGQASDMVTDYLSAFGMDASQSTYFADILAFAQSNSNTTAEQLGEAYRNAAANMHAAGQDVETTTSLLEAMANQGYKGSEAGTALAATMRDITQKMEDGAIKIGDTSIAVQDSKGNFRDLTDILMDVERATDGMGDAEKAAALGSTFTSDSIKALNMILAEGMGTISGYEDALRSAAGTSEDMAATMNDNLTGDLANMNSAFEEMQLQVFESMEEPLREGAQYLTNDVIPTLTDWVPEAFGTVASGAEKIGSALSPLINTVLKNPKGVATALTSIGAGVLAFKTASSVPGIISDVTSSVSKLGTMITSHPYAAAAAGIAAAVVAVKGAVDEYNEIQIDKSLTEHFGTIELSEPEIEDMAGRIIGVEWVANINLALGEFENAEEFHKEAEEALQANKKLLWEAKVQTRLEEQEDPVSPFVDAIQDMLDGKRDSSGLEFLANVDTTVSPNGGDNTALVEALVEFANGAVAGAEEQPVEDYAKEVAMKINPETGENEELIGTLVDFANTVISGAMDMPVEDYAKKVAMKLDPEGDNYELAQILIDFANEAVSMAQETSLKKYAKEVVVEIAPDKVNNEELIQALVEFANGIVSGASGEDLDPYLDNVLVNLTPEEGDSFMSALAQLTGEIISQKLTPTLVYEDTLSVKLTPEMQEDFKGNIESYLTSKAEELNSLTFASVASMETILGDKAGSAIISQVQSWAADDTTDMSVLSSSLTALVEEALKDGVLDVEEQAAIDILQTKINNIVSGWKEAQADAEWQTLEMKWSGKDLAPESFTSLMEEAREQRQTAIEALDADTTEMNAVFNGWLNSGKIDEAQRSQISDLWALNYRNMEGEAIGRELSFGSKSIADAYGELITENLQRIQDLGGGAAIDRLTDAADTGDWSNVIMSSDLLNSRNFYSENGGADRKAMLEMYQSMKPDVSEMQSVIDSYKEAGSEIPKALMDSYNQAIEIGAAAGDTDAAWQHYANSIMELGNEQLIDAVTNPDNPMYATLRDQMAPELADAIDRAIYAAENTTESADLSELFNSILGLDDPNAEIDLGKLSELCEKYGLDISEYLAEKGIEVDGSGAKIKIEDFDPTEAAQYAGLTATGNAITLEGGEIALEYEVNTGDTLSGIAEKTGIALDELKAANQQIFDERGTWDLIYRGDLIYIPQVETDTASVAEAAGQAAEAAQQEAQAAAEVATEMPVETTQEVNVTYEKGTEDTSALSEAGATGKVVPVTVPADVTISAGEISTSEAVTVATTQTQDDLTTAFASDFNTPGNVDVTLTEENNVPDIYSEVGAAVTSAFAQGYSASTSVAVTLYADYSLANPTKTISFGGGATGSATISATLHAEGGYFDEPHLGMVAEAGVGEYIIPIDGSERSKAMWADAGRMLGIEPKSEKRIAVNATQDVGKTFASEKTINLNLNGNVKMGSGGMSKAQVVEIIIENIKEILMDVVQQEIFEEGDYAYEY